MKYLLSFVLILLCACKKEKFEYPDGQRLPESASSLYGIWKLDALYGYDGGRLTWVKVGGNEYITFMPDSVYKHSKLTNMDHFLLSSYPSDTTLKLYRQGGVDTFSYFYFNVFANTLYLYNNGIVPSGSKYVRQ